MAQQPPAISGRIESQGLNNWFSYLDTKADQAYERAFENDEAVKKDNIPINLAIYKNGLRGLCVRTWVTGSLYTMYFRDNMVKLAKDLNVDTIEVVINTYQSYADDSTPAARVPVPDEEVDNYIKYLREQGFKVLFKHHVEVDDSTVDWRGNIDPADPDAWFANYTSLATNYATICEKYNVEIFSIGSEYKTLTEKYPNKWRTLINNIRDVFSGALTYGANAKSDNGEDEVNRIAFWDKLDYIGADFYVVPTGDTNATTSEITKAFYADVNKYNVVLNVDRLQKKYGKSVLFTEYGYQTSTELAYQSSYLDALLSVFGKTEWMNGFFLWGYNPDGFGENWINSGVKSTVGNHYSRKAKSNYDSGINLYSTKVNNSGADKWAKIASVELLYMYTTSSVTLYIEGLLANTSKQQKGNLYLRAGSDNSGLNSFVECCFNNDASFLATDIGYIKNGNMVDFYVRVANFVQLAFAKIRTNGADFFVVEDDPPLIGKPAGLVNGEKNNVISLPQADDGIILTGSITGAMSAGIIDQTITFPQPVIQCFYNHANVTDINGGNIYDVIVQTKYLGNNQLHILGKHTITAGNYGYGVQWMAICR